MTIIELSFENFFQFYKQNRKNNVFFFIPFDFFCSTKKENHILSKIILR